VSGSYDPLVKRVLDGELGPSDLPLELRAEAEDGLRLLQIVDRSSVALGSELERRVMARVRRAARNPWARVTRWLTEPREIRIRFRPWVLGPALAAVAVVLFLAGRGRPGATSQVMAGGVSSDSASVRFILYAPEAAQVTLAGTFNEWNPAATPLTRAAPGIWTTTVRLPVGQHQYAFVLDGRRWMPDPVAPHVDDGFGQTNSVLSVEAGGRTL
jgi:hypothetical protein